MSKIRYTYNLKFIIAAILAWEVIFWALYFVVTRSFGMMSGENSEQLLYKIPGALYALSLIAPVAGVYIYNTIRNNKIAGNLPDHVRQSYLRPVSTMNGFMRYFLFRNALVFLIFALAQPVFGKHKSSKTVDNLELVICLDVSNSMNTKDISKKHSRLDISKRAIIELINNLHGERIGICLFANNAFVQLPVTRDYGAAKLFVKEIETDMVSSQGTNIDAALKVSVKMFSKDRSGKGIIMITDGENHEANPNKILKKIKNSKIKLNVLGIGTKKGGLVPKNPLRPELGYKKTATGRSVKSKLNARFIRKIASRAHGKASISSSEFPDLSALLTQINQMKRTKIDNFEFDVKQERYQIPLVISLIFWLTYLLWSKRYVGLLDKLIVSK